MIELQNISAFYGRKQVLTDLSLKIDKGETVALIGPNGAGKTTLLKVISGAVKAQGNTFVNDTPIQELSGYERAGIISVVPQQIAADTPLKGYDFVMLGRTHCMPRFAPPSENDREAVEEAMQCTATQTLSERYIADMSGGERQRLALAMAFAAQPQIILLDEATAHLDLHHRAEIMQLLREMNRSQGLTILMAVHDLSLAGRYFDRLILLKNGCILKEGPPSEVLTEKNIKEAYGCPVRVVELPDSLGVAIIPMEHSEGRTRTSNAER